jgi:hypothetical protein
MASTGKTYGVREDKLRGCVTVRFVRIKPGGWFSFRRFVTELAIAFVSAVGVYRVEFDHDQDAANQVYRDAIKNG